jgi:2'-5' RNA ligase
VDEDSIYSPAFASAWSSFQAIDSLRAMGDTLVWEWSKGRAQFLAFLVRIEDTEACEYIERVQTRLDGIPGVELYPEDYWHMTVKPAGFQVIKRTLDDDILRQDVPKIARAAQGLLAGQKAFEAKLGLANGFPEVVIVEVHDGGRVRELNTLLTERLQNVPRYPFDGETWLPHVSIARFASNDGLDELKSRLAELRSGEQGPSFPVRRIEFVKAWLSEETAEFETLATYALS